MAATVRNGAGIHCRPSTLIVGRMRDYGGSLCVTHGADESNLRSVMGLMALELAQGERVSIRVTGDDETDMCCALVALFETRFDFSPRGDTAS